MMKKLFGSKEEAKAPAPAPPPTLSQMSKEQLKETEKEYKKKLNKEIRDIDKEIMKIEWNQKKAEQELEREIKKGDKSDKFIKQTYAKNVLQCRTQKNRYLQNKAKVQGLSYTLDGFFTNIRMGQVMQASADVMKKMNQCLNMKDLSQNMMEMQKEMEKMGLVSEMMDDVMAMGDEDGDVDADTEVDNIINQCEANLIKPAVNVNPVQLQNVQNPEADDFEKKLAELKD